MRRSTFCLVVALVAAFVVAVPAYAAVQNVKVSGDIDVKGIYQNDFDLREASRLDDGATSTGIFSGTTFDEDSEGSIYLSTVRLRVDADLTDNVGATIRLLNQRPWDADGSAAGDVELNLGYITLKELLYSPLTVIIGRQDLNYGTGFIVGPGLLQDPNGVFGGGGTLTSRDVTGSSIFPADNTAQQFSAFNSYDAIRLILDFDPWTIEGLVAKINETFAADNDQNLWGVNVGYKFNQYNAEAEVYWFGKRDEAAGISFVGTDHTPNANLAGRTFEYNEVHTIGVRGSAEPIANLKTHGEFAWQFGDLEDRQVAGTGGQLLLDREAWALDVGADYTWTNVIYSPSFGVGYVHFSGEEAAHNGDLEAWDPMYRGSFFTAIHDFLGGFDTGGNLYTTVDPDDTDAATNRQLLHLDASVKPLDDLKIAARYSMIWFDESPARPIRRGNTDDDAGDEIDVQITYDYTEDVQFSLIAAYFFPGDYYEKHATMANSSIGQGAQDTDTIEATRSKDDATLVAGGVRVVF